MKKMSAVAWTWILRAVGLALLTPALFYDTFVRIFPGLEDRRITQSLFLAGVLFFVAGAILFYFVRRRPQSMDSDDD